MNLAWFNPRGIERRGDRADHQGRPGEIVFAGLGRRVGIEVAPDQRFVDETGLAFPVRAALFRQNRHPGEQIVILRQRLEFLRVEQILGPPRAEEIGDPAARGARKLVMDDCAQR